VREARVEAQVRTEHPDAVRAEDAQQMRPADIQHAAFGARIDAGRHDDGCARARSPQLGQGVDDGLGRHAHDGQVRDDRQVRATGEHVLAVQGAVRGVEGADRPLEPAGAQVAPDRRADASRAVGGADHDDGSWLQQGVEMADAHGAASGGGTSREAR
jgi:hypothetical protein